MTAFDSDAMKSLSMCGFVGLIQEELNKITGSCFLHIAEKVL
jgi:F420-dependent methylenetetrahydromethanopterin dehydrogenase